MSLEVYSDWRHNLTSTDGGLALTTWNVVFDIESNNLLNNETIDYTSVPYKLKDTFKLHCIAADVIVGNKRFTYAFYDGDTIPLDGRKHEVDIEGVKYTLENYEPIAYIHKQLKDFPSFVKAIPENSVVAGQNIVNFDLLAIKLYYGIDYEIERNVDVNADLGDDYWGGKKVIFDDTLIRAKTLNPDRRGGHSLDALSSKGEVQKMQFRKHIPQNDRFKHFAADMLYYNIIDVRSNRGVIKLLDAEQSLYGWGDKWNKAIRLEKAVADIITRQEHRGFKFDMQLAERCIKDLDEKMEERRKKIEAILPLKPATKKLMGDFTPPKQQFKKNGDLSSNIIKFAEKIGAKIEGDKFIFNGVEYTLPLHQEPLVKECPAKIDDTIHIKGWLISLGWKASEYKEKDITVDTKKNKLPDDKLKMAIDRYIEQTVDSPFLYDRCAHLEINIGPRMTKDSIRAKLKHYFASRLERKAGIKVLTNPSFTVGQEKEICPDLIRLAQSSEELNCITDITEYLTFRHRRNSILGGGATWDEDEEVEKGYVSAVRDDGRIPTPADTCGAATSRFKHRLCANIPRVTSLYGWEMRSLFGVDDECYQVGYDFDSLEARQEANFCWPFEDGDVKEYCESLLLDKPNDVHTKMSEKISAIIGREFGRAPAKSVKYGATYGAQGPKIAKTIGCDVETGNAIFEAFWEAASPLKKLKDALNVEWAKFDKKRIVGIDGRLVPTRSAHAILNSKFQSAGVICAKRALVIHDRKLKECNLWLDFFKNTKPGEWCQQLIAYHK